MIFEEKIKQYAAMNCGQIARLDSPIYDSINRRHVVNIRAKYPVYIYDERDPGNYKVRILNLYNLGQIVLNDNGELVPPLTTTWNQYNENLTNLLELWKRQIENIVVTCSSDEFIRIDEFRNHLSKLEMILDHLIEYGKITKIDISIGQSRIAREKILQYMSLLEGLDLVRKNNDYYEPGNTFAGIEKGLEKEKVLPVMLSYILKNRYLTLRDIFKLTIFEKAIGVDNVIYISELELENSIYRSPKNISNEYKRYYGKIINPMNLTKILRMLEYSGAIKREKNNYFGVDRLRKDMINKKSSLVSLKISDYY